MSDEHKLRLIAHIKDRCAKSKLASPTINISREGWEYLIKLIEADKEKQQ